MHNRKKFLSFFILFTLSFSSELRAEQKITHQVRRTKDKVVVNRQNSDFIFKDQGEVELVLRVFGFNPNPFGGNNRDELISQFGLPLLTTHLFVGAGKDEAAREYQDTNCENATGDNPAFFTIIATNQAVAKQIDQIAALKIPRVCVWIKGRDIQFLEWIIDGMPQSSDRIKRMTQKSEGIDFGNPLLVSDIELVDCDKPVPAREPSKDLEN